ncbi:MAG: hypothetical protein ACSHX4_05940 [Opitutaceae bacterium]
MRAEIEDFKTGWYGLTLSIKDDEIDTLMEVLRSLKQNRKHFHLRSDYSAEGGVGDIEISIQGSDEISNIEIDSSPPIRPK